MSRMYPWRSCIQKLRLYGLSVALHQQRDAKGKPVRSLLIDAEERFRQGIGGVISATAVGTNGQRKSADQAWSQLQQGQGVATQGFTYLLCTAEHAQEPERLADLAHWQHLTGRSWQQDPVWFLGCSWLPEYAYVPQSILLDLCRLARAWILTEPLSQRFYAPLLPSLAARIFHPQAQGLYLTVMQQGHSFQLEGTGPWSGVLDLCNQALCQPNSERLLQTYLEHVRRGAPLPGLMPTAADRFQPQASWQSTASQAWALALRQDQDALWRDGQAETVLPQHLLTDLLDLSQNLCLRPARIPAAWELLTDQQWENLFTNSPAPPWVLFIAHLKAKVFEASADTERSELAGQLRTLLAPFPLLQADIPDYIYSLLFKSGLKDLIAYLDWEEVNPK